MAKTRTAISPTRQQNYAEWYQQIIKAADLAELSSVRGCMVIKPWGCALWEQIQQQLNTVIKDTGHQNIYCPLFIPLSHLQQEAEHVDGFAKECAVVTHHRLKKDQNGQLQPDGKLTEPLIVRPTSETIIGELFANWIQSYRDLPILVNQWANVVRWEMRTRMFLRTSEFLWQEGHTAHQTAEQAKTETKKMLQIYVDFVENTLAIPVLQGEKTPNERFPGAVHTYCLEAMMQNNKALQMGTSHFLGQNFSKAFTIQFTNANEQLDYAWTTSWGMSTRLIGGLIMSHSDDNGLQLPPRVAPIHAVILPILHDPEQHNAIITYCQQLQTALQTHTYHQRPIVVHIDQRALRGGEKAWSWVKKGVPLRLEIGTKEVTQRTVCVSRRDQPYQQRNSVPQDQLTHTITQILDAIQKNLLQCAQARLTKNTQIIDKKSDFYDYFQNKAPDNAGFAQVHWCGDSQLEQQLKTELGISIRCIPLDQSAYSAHTPCALSNRNSQHIVIFGKAY